MKVQIIYENGYYFDKLSGSQYLWNHDEPARRRAARRGQVKMPFSQKLRRFLRNIRREISRCKESAIGYMYIVQHGITDDQLAAYKALGIKPWERVMEFGGGAHE